MTEEAPGAAEGSALRDRFRGALLGTLLGDALGMPLEGSPPADRREGSDSPVREMLEARQGRGTGTDDTQLTVALAEALLDWDPLEPLALDGVAERFGAHFDPERGYGGNARKVLEAIREGVDWRTAVARHKLPGGSYGNGAAMRAAPCALAGFHDIGSAMAAADAQAAVTGHDHPAARFGARLQVAGVWSGLARGGDVPFDPLEAAARAEESPDMQAAPETFVDALRWVAENPDAPPAEAARRLGTDTRADRSVPAAFWAVAVHPDDPGEAVLEAVNLGGDADTIGAMAGALAGARHGAKAFPRHWVDALEEGAMGRSRLLELADQFFEAAERRDDPRS